MDKENISKNNLIEITKKIYRLTLLFPQKEPLRYKMRELADNVLFDFIVLNGRKKDQNGIDEIDRILDNLEVLDSYFAITEEQKWVSSQNLLFVWENYTALTEQIKELDKKVEISHKEDIYSLMAVDRQLQNIVDVSDKDQTLDFNDSIDKEAQSVNIDLQPVEAVVNKVSSRQEKILEFLRQSGKAQVGQFKEFFPEVTKRTLRRDFMFLLNQGIIKRIGEKNNTFYTTKEA